MHGETVVALISPVPEAPEKLIPPIARHYRPSEPHPSRTPAAEGPRRSDGEPG